MVRCSPVSDGGEEEADMSDVLKIGKRIIKIREVWADNLESEFDRIGKIVDRFPIVAMNTKFPGIVFRPQGSDYNYQTLKANVDQLKLIQLGLTFSDEHGNQWIWQFNFREFNPLEDVSDRDCIDRLRDSGIDFEKNIQRGVDTQSFGELLMSSGIVLHDDLRKDPVQWVTFHGGYDFGYLVKLLTGQNLPDTRAEFFKLINVFFPTLYDIKHLMKFRCLRGGLDSLARLLGFKWFGKCRQAGLDSLLTSAVFRKMKKHFFKGSTERYAGGLYGLGVVNTH